MIRVVVREDFTKSRCDALIADFKLALQTLDTLDAKKIQEHKEYGLTCARGLNKRDIADTTDRHQFAMRRRSTLVTPIFKKNVNNIFSDEEHSLQGQTGKTHAVC